MTIEEFKKNRKSRLETLHEALRNMPEINSDKVQGQVDVDMFDAIKRSNERDAKVKDAFKDKKKEVLEFIKAQDKATGAAEEDRAEKRLFLDEDLFED